MRKCRSFSFHPALSLAFENRNALSPRGIMEVLRQGQTYRVVTPIADWLLLSHQWLQTPPPLFGGVLLHRHGHCGTFHFQYPFSLKGSAVLQTLADIAAHDFDYRGCGELSMTGSPLPPEDVAKDFPFEDFFQRWSEHFEDWDEYFENVTEEASALDEYTQMLHEILSSLDSLGVPEGSLEDGRAVLVRLKNRVVDLRECAIALSE